MGRSEVINRLLAGVSDPAYLEIGVQNGHTFRAVKAARKIAVDPQFAFDVAAARADPANAGCDYHPVTSDAYFSDFADPRDRFDLIFIDGLHTFDQTLKDLLNALVCVKEDGLIVIDDVMPVTYASSISDISHFSRFRQAAEIKDGSWMGDVYKLVFFIEQYMPLFTYATVAENHGQTVMWRERRPSTGRYVTKVEAITRLDYADFVLSQAVFNLRPIDEIEAMIAHSRNESAPR